MTSVGRTTSRSRGDASRRPEASRKPVEVTGDLSDIAPDDALLVERLREPLRRALGEERSAFEVRIEPRGRVGEILVRITGPRGCLRLSFGREEADPGYVAGVVKDTLARFGL
jgi:hypothetical protein